MFKLISSSDSIKWNEEISKFQGLTIHYTLEYCRAFQLNGDGEPTLLKYEDETGLEGICIIMVRDVAKSPYFSNTLEKSEVFDAVTPYGYGGFVFNSIPNLNKQTEIKRELLDFLRRRNIISLFFRFSPLINNADWSRGIVNVIDLGQTIAMDLSSEQVIWANISSKNRNVIRKALREGVTIESSSNPDIMASFIPIYEATMNRDNANSYYYFNQSFYDSISRDLNSNHRIFYAVYNNVIVSVAIILFHNKFMEYHLAGSLNEYRHLGAGNLLLYKAALWGSENGFELFHLGGGLGSGEDSLYKFKAAFNRNSNYRFSIGKLIVDDNKYNELVRIRQSKDPDFNPDSQYFPLYRS